MLCSIIVSALFTARGLREPLLLDKPVTGWASSKAAFRARVQKGRANTGQAGLINVWINKEVQDCRWR